MTSKPKQVADFNYLCSTSLAEFQIACSVIGEPLTSLASKVQEAFQRTIELIEYGLNNPEPAKDSEIMKAYFNAVTDIVNMTVPKDTFQSHFLTVKEAIVALGWINVRPAPCSFIKDMKEAGEYYANRVLLNNKGEKNHIEFVNRWNQLLVDLQAYVKTHFLTGFTWGAGQGGAGGPPPPPPPPPPQFADGASLEDPSRQALLNDLNQGANVMRNLRHIDRKQLPASDAPRQKTGPTPAAKPFAAVAPTRPPKFLLEGRKWNVEFQKDAVLTVNNEDMTQSLAMYQCQGTSVEVKNKMNSVVIDSCKNCNVVVKSVISSVEMIRCDRVKIQLDGLVPLLNMDNSDSIQVFITPTSRDVEVISSKSTSCNICILEPNGDYKELPIPEQIKTVLAGNRIESNVLEKN